MLSSELKGNLSAAQKWPQRELGPLERAPGAGFEIGIEHLPIVLRANQPSLSDPALIPAVPVIELRAVVLARHESTRHSFFRG